MKIGPQDRERVIDKACNIASATEKDGDPMFGVQQALGLAEKAHDTKEIVVFGKIMKYIAPAILAFLLVGCSEDRDARARISSLETQLAFALDQNMKTSMSLGSLRVEMASKIEAESAAVVDSASKGYAIARNEYGAFPVIIDDAQPYLDGHKVKFRIANLTAATMTDVKLDIVYGARNPALPTPDQKLSEAENAKAFDQIFATLELNKKTRRKLTVDTRKDFAPASWNYVEAIITPSKPEDLGRLEVSVKINGMQLATPK